jgi:hypothetical protein
MPATDPREQAQERLTLSKEAILRILEDNKEGLSNAEIGQYARHSLRLSRISEGLLILVRAWVIAQ